MADKLFEIQRRKLLKKYEDAKQPFEATTKPYKSTLQVVFDVVEPLPAGNPTMAHLVARAPQELEFFGYGINEQIAWADGTRKATAADTNQKKGRNTNGVEDFVIEGLSATARSVRIQYAKSTDPSPMIPDVEDRDVRGAYLGLTPVMDPGSLIMPPQVQSPANLEDVLFEAVKSHMAISFEWDNRTMEPIGTLEEIPEGAAKSYLRASGEPRWGNWYRMPEGALWRRPGEPDADFVVKAVLWQPVVIPISLVGLPGLEGPRVPLGVYLDITMRVHGLTVEVPSQN